MIAISIIVAILLLLANMLDSHTKFPLIVDNLSLEYAMMISNVSFCYHNVTLALPPDWVWNFNLQPWAVVKL